MARECPGWPGCPPGGRSPGVFGGVLVIQGGLLDGGFEEFREFLLSRALSSSICCCCCLICSWSLSINARQGVWTSSLDSPFSIHPSNTTRAKKTRVIDS